MNKKGTKALASATLMSLVLTTALATGNVKAAANGQATRVGGTDRYETAAKVATANFTTSENVVLVSGEGYADSVSASVLAKKLNAPIVLTGSKTLDANAKSAIETLKAKNVYIIGGTGSISASIEDGLKSDYTVTRLGGQDRYATNLAIANKLVDLGVSKDNIIAVAGTGFADALSVAPVAAADNEILLLTKNDTDAMKATADFAKDSNVTVVGTTNVVNGDIYNQLNADKRIDGGADRFATNLLVLKAFDNDLKADKLYVASATQANPDNLYADALVASAIAGKYSAPLVLTSTEGSTATDNAVSYIGTKATKATDLQVVGGTGVVSDATVQSIEDAVKDKDTDPEVSSITANGLNQIKVVFNQEVDEDTAKDVTNYKVDGSSLTDSNATAKLQDDNKTVLITLADKQKQNDDVDVTVKKAILTADKSKTVPEFTQTVTFSDTTAPTVDSVSVRGNNKLDIKFSEPVKAKGTNEKEVLQSIVGKLKINDKNLSSYGINYDTNSDDELEYSALDNSVKASESSNSYYTDEVELYFDSELPTGSNTLKVSDADDDTLSDVAGFPIADTTEDFTVDTLTSTPKITSITSEDSGKVYINFDRPMDTKTALVNGSYTINGTKLTTSNSDFDLKKDDTQVKISGVSGLLNKNSNTINISNKVKDAYGNKVADDTNESFTLDEDTTKPTVSSVSALDEDTIRVKFSKDVDATYATNVSNYKLKDNDGTDITSNIQKTGDSTSTDYKEKNAITIPGKSSSYSVKDGDTTDVVDIHVNSNLTDSKYTLTIKNIQDTASTPNVMDDYTTTFAGSDDVSATTTAYVVNNKKIVFVFNKAMDSSTLNNTSNYQYVNGKNSTKNLPSSADISVNGDNKSVTIDLSDTSLTANPDGTDENSIVSIYATGVKDEDGNSLSTGNTGNKLVAYTSKTAVKQNSLRVYYNDDDLKADVSFDQPIDANSVDKSDFKLGDQQPTSVSVDGTKVTLTFASDTNGDDASDPDSLINQVKLKGNNAKLAIVGNVEDVLEETVDQSTQTPVYSYDAAPKLIIDKNSNNEVQNWTDPSVDGDAVDISVNFDTPIEKSSVKPSDFTFNVGGTTIDATEAEVSTSNSNTVIFKFEGSDLNDLKTALGSDSSIKVKVTPTTSSKISTTKDSAGNYAYYEPSSDDLKTNYVTVTGTSINTAISNAQSANEQAAVNAEAAKITSFAPAAAAAGTKELPTVASGYTIAVKTTDTPAVYDADGKIQSAGTANVVYTVTNTASGKTADTVSIPVTVTIQ